jgi:hypothetical protein
MLDNLVNANLEGLTGYIQYSTADLIIPQVITACAVLIVVMLLSWGIASLFSTRRTKKYRQKLVDMYIAGTVRKLAKEEGIDLDEEYKTFVKESKKKHLSEKNLDDVIEEEKAEKYIEEQEKKVKK